MTTKPKNRKRRSAAEAREDILDAAETILLEQGPAGLKFQTISKTVGMSLSTTHHHFGGISEIHSALTERMLARLIDDLTAALQDPTKDNDTGAADAIQAAYKVLGDARYAKLIAWLVLETDDTHLIDLVAPLSSIESLVAVRLAKRMPKETARQTASKIIYRVAITALGEGMIGGLLRSALQPLPADFDGAHELIASLDGPSPRPSS